MNNFASSCVFVLLMLAAAYFLQLHNKSVLVGNCYTGPEQGTVFKVTAIGKFGYWYEEWSYKHTSEKWVLKYSNQYDTFQQMSLQRADCPPAELTVK